MKLGLISQSISLATVALAFVTAGCSGTSSTPNGLDGPPGNPADPDGGSATSGPVPPHALATIVLGESHPSGQSTSTAIVAASFIPDASQIVSCSQTISGCTIATPAVCDGVTGPLCQSDQTCTLDASCKPTCQATCSVQCPTGQECYFSTASTQSCRPTQSFDGGDLVFSGSGLASAITLFPPSYAFTDGNIGNPIVPGGEIQLTGSGSTGAGFAAFQETFKATTLLQTVPSLSTLTAANVFNSQGLALGWQPGSDAILISVTGPKGTAQCSAGDASGAFSVPAAVISAVSGTGNPAITISVTRQHLEQKTDGKTQGTLVAQTVQPVGYLDLSTVSTESYTVEGCASSGESETLCSDGCVDLSSSSTDCGTCGHSCGAGYCSAGSCYGTSGDCTSPFTSCGSVCVNLNTSASNCGDCGFACPSTDSCVNGICTVGSSCGSLATCSDGCQNLQTSSTDCGECGNSCDGGTCSGGVCQTSTNCSSCESTAESGTCASYYSTCAEDANCANYTSCMSGCSTGDTGCESTCQEDYSTGATEAEDLRSCVCSTVCSSSCSTTTYCTETL
jgi:hypothetical protein